MTEHEHVRSSIAAEDWLPVQQALLRGLNHSLSNRLASLSALTMLIESGDRLDSRMQDALSADVERLGGLLELFRALPGPAVSRREGTRFGDALQRAGALVAHHPDCRDVEIASVVEESDAPPVTLSSEDATRASVLLLLAVARAAASPAPLRITARAGGDGWLYVTAELEGASCAQISQCAEHGALARFATAEHGRVVCTPGDVADAAGRLTLALPGLGLTRGR